jgi:hypothetical protein
MEQHRNPERGNMAVHGTRQKNDSITQDEITGRITQELPKRV